MLKTLLGHWKSHRKKPSLLPEDDDIHFEDPSKINPLFEDSDSSSSSLKRPQSENSGEQNQIKTETFEQTPNRNNVPVANELVDVSVPASSSEVIQSELSASKDETETPEKDKTFIALNTVSESEDLNIETSIDLECDDVNLIPFEPSEKETSNISAEDEVRDLPAKTEDNMRILHQPSPSAIFNANKRSSNQVPGKNKESLSIVSPISTETQNVEKYEKQQENVPKKKVGILKNNEEQSRLQSSQNVKENFTQSKSVQSIDQVEKPAKLKAKAIDELIKKFQGPTTNDDKVTSNSQKLDKITLTNAPEEDNKSINNVAKTEKKDSFQIPKTESTEKPETSNKDSPDKEALSNIFKFPPPPPLENSKNESSLHGRILHRSSTPSSSHISTSKCTVDNSNTTKESEPGKTRSDSSLDRTRTASSKKPEVNTENTTSEHETEPTEKLSEICFKESFLHSSNIQKSLQIKTPLALNSKDSKRSNDTSTQSKNIKEDITHKSILENTKTPLPEAKIIKSDPIVSNDSITAIKEFVAEKTEKDKSKAHLNKTQPVLLRDNALSKAESPIPDPKVEASTSFSKANVSQPQNEIGVPAQKLKSSVSKGSVRNSLKIENENVKSHSEDSGITRGDQISSETTQDASPSNPPEETKNVPNSAKKNRKEKKLKSISKKHSKNCRRSHNDSTSLKRGQFDDYYDVLTGFRHVHRNKHSDSCTSDISWEERELLRRLRSRRGTVRSNTPSTRSRLSKRRFMDENHFRRPYNFRRSFSDESTFFGSSLCSCDECWTQYMKGYERASLRGMPPIHQMCTCHIPRNNLLGRRVQFRSDPIPEATPSEKTTRTTSPAPTTDDKQEEDDAEDDKSSQKSSQKKDNDSVKNNPDGSKDKKLKFSEEAYRIMTPWELEEWDYLMKKQLLQRRRRRARCMGIMALAMVVFVGLVVAILMVYLRRKVL